jgi:hypothetical protein
VAIPKPLSCAETFTWKQKGQDSSGIFGSDFVSGAIAILNSFLGRGGKYTRFSNRKTCPEPMHFTVSHWDTTGYTFYAVTIGLMPCVQAFWLLGYTYFFSKSSDLHEEIVKVWRFFLTCLRIRKREVQACQVNVHRKCNQPMRGHGNFVAPERSHHGIDGENTQQD